MIKAKTAILVFAIACTAASLFLWQATGGDYYTKFEVVEEVEEKLDPDDPLAEAGFYENDSVTRTVTRKGLRFGLFPAPQGILDKHSLSVVTFIFPVWLIAAILLWRAKKKLR